MTFHDSAVVSAEAILYDVLTEVFTPPPPIDYLDWAKENIVFSDRISDRPGPYDEDAFPFFNEIFAALGPDDPCQTVTLRKSAQVGGTVAANIFTLGAMDMDPCDLLYVHPTEGNAIKWSNQKLVPLLRETTALAGMFPLTTREGKNSTLYKERRDGRGAISAAGANSPASLSMVSPRKQVQDDLSKWEINAAGDPEKQADTRSKSFLNRKVFKISTPLKQPGCRITANYEAGSQEEYHVPCPHCGELQALRWENMEPHLDPAHPERAAFWCVHCGSPIEEHHRAQIVRPVERGGQARWVARYPERKRYHRSFHIWLAYSALESWESLARRWFSIKAGEADGDARDHDAEQVFYNDDLGLPYQVTGEAPDWELLQERAEKTGHRRGIIPPGALIVTIGVDVQGDRVEWQAVGWGANRHRYVIDYGVFDMMTNRAGGKPHSGHISEPEIQAALDDLLRRRWPDSFGNHRICDLLAIDGNAWTAEVFEWTKRHPVSRVIMTRGIPNETAVLLELVRKDTDKSGRKLRRSKRFFNLAVSILKGALYRDLKKTDPQETGYVHLAKGMEDDGRLRDGEYYKQLTSEKRIGRRGRDGVTIWRWTVTAGVRNEVLDTMNVAEGAAIRLGIRSYKQADWDRLSAALEVMAEDDDGQMSIEDALMTKPAEPVAATAPAHPEKKETARRIEAGAPVSSGSESESPAVAAARRRAEIAKRRLGKS